MTFCHIVTLDLILESFVDTVQVKSVFLYLCDIFEKQKFTNKFLMKFVMFS